MTHRFLRKAFAGLGCAAAATVVLGFAPSPAQAGNVVTMYNGACEATHRLVISAKSARGWINTEQSFCKVALQIDCENENTGRSGTWTNLDDPTLQGMQFGLLDGVWTSCSSINRLWNLQDYSYVDVYLDEVPAA